LISEDEVNRYIAPENRIFYNPPDFNLTATPDDITSNAANPFCTQQGMQIKCRFISWNGLCIPSFFHQIYSYLVVGVAHKLSNEKSLEHIKTTWKIQISTTCAQNEQQLFFRTANDTFITLNLLLERNGLCWCAYLGHKQNMRIVWPVNSWRPNPERRKEIKGKKAAAAAENGSTEHPWWRATR